MRRTDPYGGRSPGRRACRAARGCPWRGILNPGIALVILGFLFPAPIRGQESGLEPGITPTPDVVRKPPEKGAPRDVEYHLIPSVTIDDRATIDFFVEEFFLPETSYTSIEVIDTESNGFGKNDLLKFHPSGGMYYLDMVTDTAQAVMNGWEMEQNVEIVTDRLDPARYDSVGTAEFGILGSLAKGVERNYGDAPININMRRDSTGVVFEMWGYNADSLAYKPPPPAVPDSVPVFDLLQSYRTEQTILPDSTAYDLLFIYRSESDTVFLEGPREDAGAD